MSFEIRELSEQPQRALLVGIGVPGDEKREREALLAELEDLVSNLGIGIAESRVIWTRELQAKYLCGIGKAEEIRDLTENLKADALIIDNLLSPSQQREWEKLTELPVKDREEVILDVFASRARTREATMQVGREEELQPEARERSKSRWIVVLLTNALKPFAPNWKPCAASEQLSVKKG